MSKDKTGDPLGFMPAFYEAMFDDLREHHNLYESWSEDKIYLLSRLETEGTQFATHMLPKLGKAVEVSYVSLQELIVPEGFSLEPQSKLPHFMNYFFKKLFMTDGTPRWRYAKNGEPILCTHSFTDINDAPFVRRLEDLISIGSSDALKGLSENRWKCDKEVLRLECNDGIPSCYQAVRQITCAFAKVVEVCPQALAAERLKEFKERISKDPNISNDGFTRALLKRGRLILSKLFPSAAAMSVYDEWASYLEEPFGRHGPGAVEGGEKGREKWEFDSYPGIDRHLYQWTSENPFKGKRNLPYSRAITVPKDHRGPRIICVEPKETQFAQQGLMLTLYKFFSHHLFLRRSITLGDQRPSQAMCYNRNYCTIDLKDASDMISLDLVKLLFPKWIYKLMVRYRSPFVEIQGEKIRSRAFATMGNALCFPVETLTFWCITKAAVALRGHPKDPMRVFGDDIIVTERNFSVVAKALVSCGLVLNQEKTCSGMTPIRESCGEYTFLGRTVKTVRFKSIRTSSKSDYLAALEYAKGLSTQHYYNAAQAILINAEKVCAVPRMVWLGCTSRPWIRYAKERWNRNLQRIEVRQPVIVESGRVLPLTGSKRLYALKVGNAIDPFFNGHFNVKMKWIPSDSLL